MSEKSFAVPERAGKRKPAPAVPAPQRAEIRRALSAPRLQAKLTVGQPDDAYEREADRVAEQVTRGGTADIASPSSPRVQRACSCGGSCDSCRKKDEELRRSPESAAPAPAEAPASVHAELHSPGRPLEQRLRERLEPRFGVDFGGVRIHIDSPSARDVSARAYTVGSDIVFAPGQYAPGTAQGDRLLAHELTHVVQQSAGGSATGTVRLRSEPRVAGDWIIRDPDRKVDPAGETDAEILAQAFHEICDGTSLSSSGDRIVVGPGSASAGCRCLEDIEDDPGNVLKGKDPEVQLQVNGWSYTIIEPVLVSARHPDGPLEWGYWTGKDERRSKPFRQTLAHEICGHVAPAVRTGGTVTGIRGEGEGHNPAIAGENEIAAEHGVAPDDQRGMEMDASGKPLPGHRGESFLRGTVDGFDNGKTDLPSGAGGVLDAVVATVEEVKNNNPHLKLRIQVVGSAYSDEGEDVAAHRAAQVQAAIRRRLKARKIGRRFGRRLARVDPGLASGASGLPAQRVYVYLYHNEASEE